MAARYLTTDLNLYASFDLTPLTQAFEKVGLSCVSDSVLRPDGRWRAAISCHVYNPTPDRAAKFFLKYIRRLDDEGRRLWQACSLREFDLGFEFEEGNFSDEFQIGTDLLQQMIEEGVSVQITIYQPRKKK